jgi:transglutaminase-like putative cysteine protease
VTATHQYRASFERDLAATAALTAYSLSVAVGFARVFNEWGFLGDLALLVIIGHGTSFALRRMRVSGWLAIPFIGALLLWVLVALHYSETLTWLVPRGATWDQIDLEVGLVRDDFQTTVAPVLYGAGWDVLAGFALIVAVVMADAFAFRAEARGEALVPGGVLFVFIAALGSSRLRISVTALLIATGVLAVVALRAMHDRSRRVELTSARGPGSMIVPSAVATAAAIAVIAGIVGPRIPGADAEPLYNTKGRGGGVTDVINPIVDIRSRLTNRGNVELFRVNADARAYWRVTTLPAFNGRQFGQPRTPLERVPPPSNLDDRPRITQRIQVLELGGRFVPAAADPVQAEGSRAGEPIELRQVRDSDALVALSADHNSSDLFTVVSAVPNPSPDQLRGATADSPPNPIFLELPDNLPSLVGDLAAEVTGDTSNPYDAALALQNWFQNEFEYSLVVQSGHGSNAIESFLKERIGYCEQFSATFAAMARTQGLPTRVAVGYTWGTLQEDGYYSVLGKNSHAWPEVWFDDIGWVAFEPTPGRGAPGAEAYTNLPAQQDDTPAEFGGDGTLVVPTTPSTVVAPPTTIGPGGPTATTLPGDGTPRQFPENDPDRTFAGDEPAAAVEESGFPWRVTIIIAVVLLALTGPEITRRLRSRAIRAHGAVDRVHLAWLRARTAAERAGVIGRSSMTPTEWAAATANRLPVAARPMRSLADIVDQVSYAPPGHVDLERGGTFGATLGQDCELWSRQIDRIAADTFTPTRRVKHYFTDLR